MSYFLRQFITPPPTAKVHDQKTQQHVSTTEHTDLAAPLLLSLEAGTPLSVLYKRIDTSFVLSDRREALHQIARIAEDPSNHLALLEQTSSDDIAGVLAFFNKFAEDESVSQLALHLFLILMIASNGKNHEKFLTLLDSLPTLFELLRRAPVWAQCDVQCVLTQLHLYFPNEVSTAIVDSHVLRDILPFLEAKDKRSVKALALLCELAHPERGNSNIATLMVYDGLFDSMTNLVERETMLILSLASSLIQHGTAAVVQHCLDTEPFLNSLLQSLFKQSHSSTTMTEDFYLKNRLLLRFLLSLLAESDELSLGNDLRSKLIRVGMTRALWSFVFQVFSRMSPQPSLFELQGLGLEVLARLLDSSIKALAVDTARTMWMHETESPEDSLVHLRICGQWATSRIGDERSVAAARFLSVVLKVTPPTESNTWFTPIFEAFVMQQTSVCDLFQILLGPCFSLDSHDTYSPSHPPSTFPYRSVFVTSHLFLQICLLDSYEELDRVLVQFSSSEGSVINALVSQIVQHSQSPHHAVPISLATVLTAFILKSPTALYQLLNNSTTVDLLKELIVPSTNTSTQNSATLVNPILSYIVAVLLQGVINSAKSLPEYPSTTFPSLDTFLTEHYSRIRKLRRRVTQMTEWKHTPLRTIRSLQPFDRLPLMDLLQRQLIEHFASKYGADTSASTASSQTEFTNSGQMNQILEELTNVNQQLQLSRDENVSLQKVIAELRDEKTQFVERDAARETQIKTHAFEVEEISRIHQIEVKILQERIDVMEQEGNGQQTPLGGASNKSLQSGVPLNTMQWATTKSVHPYERTDDVQPTNTDEVVFDSFQSPLEHLDMLQQLDFHQVVEAFDMDAGIQDTTASDLACDILQTPRKPLEQSPSPVPPVDNLDWNPQYAGSPIAPVFTLHQLQQLTQEDELGDPFQNPIDTFHDKSESLANPVDDPSGQFNELDDPFTGASNPFL